MVVGINRYKASSHPTQSDGIYLGAVRRVLPDGKVFVYIPKLSNTLGPLRVTNLVSSASLSVDDRVLCANVGGGSEEMYVIGHVRPLVISDLRDMQISMYMEVY